MDAGRQWALETFGEYGPQIRARIPQLVRAEHLSSADAQEASEHRSQSIYGQFWVGILERFTEFGELPGAELVRPGGAPYKIPVVNGVAIYPWRYAKNRDTELSSAPFSTSGARLAATRLSATLVQGYLPLDLPDPGLTVDEKKYLDAIRQVAGDPVVTSGRMVMVAISSSVRGLFALEWGLADVSPAGSIEWEGFNESLLEEQPSAPVSMSSERTFTAGVPPRKFPDEAESGSGEN